MSKIFRGPTYRYKIGRPHELWFVSYPVGKTVIKNNGTWQTVMVPKDSDLSTYQRVLRGGYDNVITDAEAAELTAAGYGDYIWDE
jgi:hypothetical protein